MSAPLSTSCPSAGRVAAWEDGMQDTILTMVVAMHSMRLVCVGGRLNVGDSARAIRPAEAPIDAHKQIHMPSNDSHATTLNAQLSQGLTPGSKALKAAVHTRDTRFLADRLMATAAEAHMTCAPVQEHYSF